MDLMTLDANNQPAKLIENYDSLIWTERFNTVGDFQLVAGDPGGFLSLLPEGTRLTLRDSNVVMVVETHQIDRKKNTPQKITISGRSFESILDRRAALQAITSVSDWNVNVKTAADAAYYAMVQVCVNGVVDALDIFPTTMVQFPTPADYLTGTGPTRSMTVPRGNLLSAVLSLLQTESKADATTTPATPAQVQHGIRAVRPNTAGTAVAIQTYVGTDRTATIYFDATRDLLDDGTYLFSKVNSASTALVVSGTSVAKINTLAAPLSGLDRRVILVDGSGSSLNTGQLQAAAESALTDAKITALFDGSINQDISPYKYNVDYMLGDTVRLVGDYGLVQNARVTEFIRSEDNNGSKAYPTLVTI